MSAEVADAPPPPRKLSSCADLQVLEDNYRYKMQYSPDYKGVDIEAALADFKQRIAKYDQVGGAGRRRACVPAAAAICQPSDAPCMLLGGSWHAGPWGTPRTQQVPARAHAARARASRCTSPSTAATCTTSSSSTW
jgi:hypothetical protein